MVPAPHQQTRYTTLTYYGGVTATTDPLVVVRRETLTSVLTTPLPSRGSFVERTQVTALFRMTVQFKGFVLNYCILFKFVG